EGNHVTETDDLPGLFKSISEAVENSAQPAGVILQNMKRFLPCVALMDHDVQPELRGEIELLLEERGLCRDVGSIANLAGKFLRIVERHLREPARRGIQ